MPDNILRAVAKTIASNRDMMLVHINDVKTELDEKIATIKVAANVEVIDSTIVEALVPVNKAIEELATLTASSIELSGNELVSQLKLTQLSVSATNENITSLLGVVKQLDSATCEGFTQLTERVEKTESVNNDTLNLVAERLEQLVEPIADASNEIVKAGIRIDDVNDRITELELEVGNSLSSLQKQILNSNEKTAELVLDVATQIPFVEAKVDGLVEAVSKQLHDVLEVKTWCSGIHRAGLRVKHNLGDQYIAKIDTVEEPSPQANDWALIECGIRFRGLHNEQLVYTLGDFVVKDGSTWMYDGESLRLMAMRGEKGQRGEKGPIGPISKSGLTEPEIKSVVADSLVDVYAVATEVASEAARNVVKDSSLLMFVSKSDLGNALSKSKTFEELKTNLLLLVN